MLLHPPYSLLDFGDSLRYEQWGKYSTIRPDKSATGFKQKLQHWQADAHFNLLDVRGGNGRWEYNKNVPLSWYCSIGTWNWVVGLGTTKQLGVFPEQLPVWTALTEVIHQCREQSESCTVLNGFGYTGAASIVASLAGAKVTHVDSNAAAIGRAKENQALNGLPADSIRWIREDVPLFMERELRRQKTYDCIVLDPPSFGHGAKGEQFRLGRDLQKLLTLTNQLLNPGGCLFLTTYSSEFSATGLLQMCKSLFKNQSVVQTSPLVLHSATGHQLTTGLLTKISIAN